jgi:molybdopterin molybdotransferase
MKTPLLLVEAAQTQLLNHARGVAGDVETIPIHDVLGRVLAQDYVATFDVPSGDNSAMDGYAVCARDLAVDKPTRLKIAQYIPAGQAPEKLLPNTAARIFTGALLPECADTIVLQEDCKVENNEVIIPAGIHSSARQYVRKQGSDFKKGDVILQKGVRVCAVRMGMLATLGVGKVTVYKRLRVAICSTGDELIEPGEPLSAGKLYNSNRFVLRGLLQQMGVDVVDIGAIKDDKTQLKNAFINAVEQADCLITSGGASEGDKDFIHELVTELGDVAMWKLAIKPGKPFLFGSLAHEHKSIPFFGLPGNPVSAFVTFLILVKPYLLRCQGIESVLPTIERVKSSFTWQTTHRQEYVRVQKNSDHNGESRLTVYTSQNSAVFSSLLWATGLAIVPPHTQIQEGDYLDYLCL